MYYHLELARQCLGGTYPSLCQAHALFLGEHVALATASVYKYTLHAVLLQHGSICGNGFQVHIAISIERGEWRIDKSDNLFHNI